MRERPHVHALLYTATCGEILEPILMRLADDPGIRVSATTLLPTAILGYSRLSRSSSIEVEVGNAVLTDFVTTPGPGKLLLLVADWTHVAHTIGREAVHAARQSGIPSLSVQHGVFFLRDGKLVSWDFTADRMCVWGDWFRDRLLDAGKTPERLVLTGNPRLSGAKCQESTDGVANRQSTAVVALATHAQLSYPELEARWNAARIESMVAAVFRGLMASGIERVIVRPHPAEIFWNRVGVYTAAARSVGAAIEYSNYYDEDDDLFALLSGADVVVTQGSTVGLYAIHCGTPVLSLSLDADETLGPTDPYYDGHLYRRITPDPETLAERLQEAVTLNPSKSTVEIERRAFLAPYFSQTDGVEEIIATISKSLRT